MRRRTSLAALTISLLAASTMSIAPATAQTPPTQPLTAHDRTPSQMTVIDEIVDLSDYEGIGTDTISLYEQSPATAPRWLQRRHPALAADARRDQRTAPSSRHAAARSIGTYNNSAYMPGTGGQHLPTFCAADGTSGKRVQAMYVREASDPDRYSAVKNVILEELRLISDGYYVSGIQTGGGRQIRWVTEAGCALSILNVTVPNGALDTFNAGLQALDALGYNRPDRKYLIFADEEPGSGINCGLGTTFTDESATNNLNDTQSGYARVDTLCWTRGENNFHSSAMHELTHTLGAIQDGAPNTSGAGHCIDEFDVMCYADGGPKVPASGELEKRCGSVLEDLLDCNGEDYFNVNPASGSYLATHWNVANSGFLADDGVRPGAKVTLSLTGPSSPETGDQFTLTADHSDLSGATYRWTSNAPSCLKTGLTSRTVTVQCTDFSGPLNITVEVKKPSSAIVIATRDIEMRPAAGTFGQISGPNSASENQVFTLTASAVQGKAPFTYQWDAFDPRCTLISGTRTTPSVSLSCVRAGGADEIVDFRVTVTGADASSGVASHGVAILTGGGGGGGGGDGAPVITLSGPNSVTPGQTVRITATADIPIGVYENTVDQNQCYANQITNNTWDVGCFASFTGLLTFRVTGTTSTGKAGTAAKTISVSSDGGGGGTNAIDIEGATAGTAGRPLTLSTQVTGEAVNTWRWTISEPGCQSGPVDRSTVTIWCDAETTGPVQITVQGVTGSGQTETDSEVVTMAAPSVNLALITPSQPVTSGANATIRATVTENGTGAPLKARIGLERSRDGGQSWTSVRAPSVASDGSLSVTETINSDTLYRATGGGATMTGEVTVANTPGTEDVRLKIDSVSTTSQSYRFAGAITSASGAALPGMTIKVQYRVVGTSKWRVLTKTQSTSGGKISAVGKVTRRSDVRFKSLATDQYRARKSSSVRIKAFSSQSVTADHSNALI